MAMFRGAGNIDISVSQTAGEVKASSLSDSKVVTRGTINSTIVADEPDVETVDLDMDFSPKETKSKLDTPKNVEANVEPTRGFSNQDSKTSTTFGNEVKTGNIDPGDLQQTKRDRIAIDNASSGKTSQGDMSSGKNPAVESTSGNPSSSGGPSVKAPKIKMSTSDEKSSISTSVGGYGPKAQTDTGTGGSGSGVATMSNSSSISSGVEAATKQILDGAEEVKNLADLAYEQSTLRTSEEFWNDFFNMEPEEQKEFLKSWGLIDADIDRFLNGEVTLPDLMAEIENDPDRYRLILEASSIHQSGLECNNLEDLSNVISSMQAALDKLLAERAKLTDNLPNSFLDVIKDVEDGQSLEEAAKNHIAGWEYTDSEGHKIFVAENPYQDGKNPDAKNYRPVTVYEKCMSNDPDSAAYREAYKELESMLTTKEIPKLFSDKSETIHVYEKDSDQSGKLKDIVERYTEEAKTREEKLAELDQEIAACREELAAVQYVYDHTKEEVDSYMNNVFEVVRADDFEENNQYDPSCQDKVDAIFDRYSYASKNTWGVVEGQDEADVLACIINGGSVSDGFVKLKSKDGLVEFYQKVAPQMTDEEKAVFNYIYNTKGGEAAIEYAQDISTALDGRWLIDQTQKDAEFAREHKVIASIGSVFITPVEGFSATCASMNELLNHQKIKRADVYSAGNVWRSSVSECIKNDYLAFAYDTGMSMIDSGLLVAAGALTGGVGIPAISAALMGSRSYVSTLNQALDKGMSDGSAVALAWSAAAVETAMESYSVGHLLNLEGGLKVVTENLVKKFGINHSAFATKTLYIFSGAISQGLAEGEEELGTEILNYVFDEMISGDLSDYAQSIDAYMAQGYSKSEAELLTFKDLGKRAGMAFLGGFVSGLGFGSFGSLRTVHNTNYAISHQMYQDLETGGSTGATFTNALEINLKQMEDYDQAMKASHEVEELLKMEEELSGEQYEDFEKDLKRMLYLTPEQMDLLQNGTVEMQAVKQRRQEAINRVRAFMRSISNKQGSVGIKYENSKKTTNLPEDKPEELKTQEEFDSFNKSLQEKGSGQKSGLDTIKESIKSKAESLNLDKESYKLKSKDGKLTGTETAREVGLKLKTGEITIKTALEYMKGLNSEGKFEVFKEFAGEEITRWFDAEAIDEEAVADNNGESGKVKAARSFTNLLKTCDKAGIEIGQLNKALDTMKLFEPYYDEAAKINKDNGKELETNEYQLDTYRTHGIVHILDVLNRSVQTANCLKQAGKLGPGDMESVMLSAVLHDTGMVGGSQISIEVKDGKLEISVVEAQKDAVTYRESHSYLSGKILLDNAETLQQLYSPKQIAEAALLTFAHSKSNSGLGDLTVEAGWSFAIQALQIGTGNNFDLTGELARSGVLLGLKTEQKEVTVKTPKQFKTEDGEFNGTIKSIEKSGKRIVPAEEKAGGGKKTGNIDTYEMNFEMMKRLAYMAESIRIGDAWTNNDNAGYNQFRQAIDTSETSYGSQLSFEEIIQKLISKQEAEIEENKERLDDPAAKKKYEEAVKIKTELDALIANYGEIEQVPTQVALETLLALDLLADLGEIETSNGITYNVGEEVKKAAQQFVLGENNQEYLEPYYDKDTDTLCLGIKLKDSSVIPLCNIFAINERFGELTSKGKTIFTKKDGMHMKLQIQLDTTVIDKTTLDLYENYINILNQSIGKDTEVKAEIINENGKVIFPEESKTPEVANVQKENESVQKSGFSYIPSEEVYNQANQLADYLGIDYNNTSTLMRMMFISMGFAKENINNNSHKGISFLVQNLEKIIDLAKININGGKANKSSYNPKQKTVFIDKYATKIQGVFGALMHEFGHAIHLSTYKYNENAGLSKQERETLRKARENYQVTPERIKLLESVIEQYIEINRAIDLEFEARVDNELDKFINNISSYSIETYIEPLLMKYAPSVLGNLNEENVKELLNNNIELREKLIEDRKLFLRKEIEDEKFSEFSNNESIHYGEATKLCAMLNSLLMSDKRLTLPGSEYDYFRFFASHSNEYWERNEDLGFEELMADYFLMQATGNQKFIESAKILLGEDVIKILDSKYEIIADYMERSLEEGGMFYEIFPIDDEIQRQEPKVDKYEDSNAFFMLFKMSEEVRKRDEEKAKAKIDDIRDIEPELIEEKKSEKSKIETSPATYSYGLYSGLGKNKNTGVKSRDLSKLTDAYIKGENASVRSLEETKALVAKLASITEEERQKYSIMMNRLSRKSIFEGLSDDEIQQQMDEYFAKNIVEKSDVGIRMGIDNLIKCLDDGNIKNLFETEKSYGTPNRSLRADVEERMFGVKQETAYSDRPIYGFLLPSGDNRTGQDEYILNGPGQHYGEGMPQCVIIFNKEAIVDCSTCTIGDSLDYDDRIGASPLNDPKFKGAYNHLLFGSGESIKNMTLEELTGTESDTYVEVQIHGHDAHQMNSDTVKEIVFYEKPDAYLQIQLKKKGIKWRVVGK